MPAKCRDIAAIITVLPLHSPSPSLPSFISIRVKRAGEIDREGRRKLKRIDIRISSTKKVGAREKRGCLRIRREWKSEVDVRMPAPFQSTWKSCIGRLGLSVWTLSRQIEISFRPEFRMDIGRERSDRFRRWIYDC